MKSRPLLFFVVFALVAPSRSWAETFGLVIGVNETPQFELAGGVVPRPLRGAESDARLAADTLRHKFHVADDRLTLLLGDAATCDAVRAALHQLALKTCPADTVVVHFSGHGTQLPDSVAQDEADGLDEALCLHDARADGTGLLLDDELGRLLEELAADDVIVVLDCCHAGTGIKDDGDDVPVPRYLPIAAAAGKRRPTAERPWRDVSAGTKSLTRQTTAFFACLPEQQAYERRLPDVEGRAGQFSHYFWTGLRDGTADADGDGAISRQEAIAYAAGRLDETFNRNRATPAERQSPNLEADRPHAILLK